MAGKVYIVGIGPGHPDYILPAADRIIRSCDYLAGGERALALYPECGKKRIFIKNDLEKIVVFINENTQYGDVAVLVSGDPGFYSMLPYLKNKLSDTDIQIEVIPGISSMQMAFCRAGMPWQKADVFSLHGREESDWINRIRVSEAAGMLTDKKNTPAVIAQKILEAGVTDRKVIVCENLSYPEERIVRGELKDILDMDFSDSVIIVYR